MSADLLRRAAALMRERAEAATMGTWRVVPINGDKRADIRTEPELGYDYRGTAVATAADSEFGAVPMRDAVYIASLHPAVALALAFALDEEAGTNFDPPELIDQSPLVAVARAYLGEDA